MISGISAISAAAFSPIPSTSHSSSLDAEKAIWRWEVYVTTADGKITKTTLGIHKPLRAGQLKILKVKLHDTGIVTVEDPTVAVGVELDWNPGLNHDIPL